MQMNIVRAQTPEGGALAFKRVLVGTAGHMNDVIMVLCMKDEAVVETEADALMMTLQTADLLDVIAQTVPESRPVWRPLDEPPPIDVHVLVGNPKGEAIACWRNHDGVYRTAQGLPVRLDFMTHWCLHTPIPRSS